MMSRKCLPSRARRLTDRSELPSALQRIAIHATGAGKSWSAWAEDEGIWFYAAEMTPARLCGQKCPVLKLKAYGRKGRIEEYGFWARTRRDGWQRCVRKSGKDPQLVAANS
jgi:hypothetical protein